MIAIGQRRTIDVKARIVTDALIITVSVFFVAFMCATGGHPGIAPQTLAAIVFSKAGASALCAIAVAVFLGAKLNARARFEEGVEVMAVEQRLAPYGATLATVLALAAFVLVRRGVDEFEVGSLMGLMCLTICRQIFIIWNNRLLSAMLNQREEELTRYAFHDALTSLANRVALDLRFKAMVDSGGVLAPAALMMLDLDRFKRINDTLGHPVGDELLKVVAERITRCVRPNDTVVRMGGDEFAIVLESYPDVDAILKVADRIVQSITEPIVIEGRTVDVGASVGVALASSEIEPLELIRNADMALYSVKNAGGNAARVYDSSLSVALTERLDLESQMARALDRGEFYVAYQPIFDLRSGRPAGVEALLRWRHPSGTVWPAERFLASAEETGLIVPLGRFALIEAVNQVSRWRQRLPGGEDIFAAVNISSRQLLSDDFTETFAKAIIEAGMSKGAVHLEVSESLVAEHAADARELTEIASAIGVNLSLDDFGTGYSSLSYLGRLPISSLKIDRTFIDRLGLADSETLIIEAVSALADALELEVIGEGIETIEQLQRLRALNCRYGQGYLLGMPMVAEELQYWWEEFMGFSPAPTSLPSRQ